MAIRKSNSNSATAPWDSPEAAAWLGGFEAWRQTIRLIHGSLQLEARTHPQEIRAAAAMVVLFCRENLWPQNENEIHDPILEMAARQLSTVKQLYETKSRLKPELQSNKNYRNLLTSIDQEIRILEARLSNPKPKMPNQPPCTWGQFWTDETDD